MNSDKIKYLFPIVICRCRLYRNRLWKYCKVERISLAGYKPFDNAYAFKERLQAMLGVFDAYIIKDLKEADKNVILTAANQALRHEFDLLGSGPVLIEPIDWHTDFKSGARWGKKWYYDINRIGGSDIKVPWELSRCQHLLWLGEAFLLTRDSKYAQEVIDEINWWIDDNPLMYSVNWTCSMDVAFRSINWIYALNMISTFEGFDDVFTAKVTKSLWQHGFYIRNNLEKIYPYSNNHYASDIVGLLYLGELFAAKQKGKKWLKYGKKEFFKEIRQQIFPSGVHYERSISYHRLMTEMLSYSVYMLQRLGEKVPSNLVESIKSMYRYIGAYTKPNGLSPLFGDNDDGRFVPFIRRDFRAHNYLNHPASVENKFASVGLKPFSYPEINKGGMYEDAGIAIINQSDSYLFINFGGYSKRPSEKEMIIPTHTHNDFLSFELALNRKDIIIDSGAYLYTSDENKRDDFRRTAKHNTIVVDGEEQNELFASFALKRNVRSIVYKSIAEGLFEGEYETIGGGMHHNRQFSFSNNKLTITDSLNKPGEGHVAKLYLHLAEGIEPLHKGDSIELNNIAKMLFDSSPSKIEILEDTISPSFGVIKKVKIIIATYIFDNKISFKTTIYGLK